MYREQGGNRVAVQVAGPVRWRGGWAASLVGGAALVAVVAAGLLLARAERGWAVQRSAGRGEAVATALETYRLEFGRFPATRTPAGLAQALQPFLAGPRLGRPGTPFRYTAGRNSYRLAFTPSGGGVPVGGRAGQGASLMVAGHLYALPW
jgi:hypothetical protein